DRRPGLHEQHQFAGAFDGLDELLDRVAADEVFALGATVDQLVHFAGRAVEHSDFVTATFDVEGQVLAHHRQTNETEIAVTAHVFHRYLIDAKELTCGP